jgi:hypothetical protein
MCSPSHLLSGDSHDGSQCSLVPVCCCSFRPFESRRYVALRIVAQPAHTIHSARITLDKDRHWLQLVKNRSNCCARSHLCDLLPKSSVILLPHSSRRQRSRNWTGFQLSSLGICACRPCPYPTGALSSNFARLGHSLLNFFSLASLAACSQAHSPPPLPRRNCPKQTQQA